MTGPIQVKEVIMLARILAEAQGFNYGGLSPVIRHGFEQMAAAAIDAGYSRADTNGAP